MMDVEYAAERLKNGVQRAVISDKYDQKVSDPSTHRKYAVGFARFVGHPVPNAASSYIDSVSRMVINWDSRPTDAKKWVEAMRRIE